MDVEDEGQGAARKRGGKRRWVIAGGAAAVAFVAAVGVVLARSGPQDIAAPRTCHTAAHGTAPSGAPAKGAGTPAGTAPAADFDGDGHPDLALGALGDVENAGAGGSIAVAYGSGDGTGLARCQYLTQNDGRALVLCVAVGAVAPLVMGLWNVEAVVWAAAGAPLAAVYPYMKRVTHWPHVWLGISINWTLPLVYVLLTGGLGLGAGCCTGR